MNWCLVVTGLTEKEMADGEMVCENKLSGEKKVFQKCPPKFVTF